MLQSVLSVILYNGNKSDDSQEESTTDNTNHVNLLKSKTKLKLYDLDNINVRGNYEIQGKMFSHLQKYHCHISLKFLPYVNHQSSFRNIRPYYRFDKYHYKDYFQFFTKLFNPKKHNRKILTQKKIGYIKHKMGNNYLYTNDKLKKKNKELHYYVSNKEELNSKMTSCHNNIFESNVHSHCTYTSGNMYDHASSTIAFPKMKMEEFLPLDKVADLFANLNLNRTKIENNSTCVNLITKFKENQDNMQNAKPTLFNNINTMCKPIMEESANNFLTTQVNKSIQLLHDNSIPTNCSSKQCKIDFCSGDDSTNEYSNLKYLINDISDTKELVQVHSEDISSKTRSIQWNTEVNVIYYASDINGGKKIWKKVEPLHEEANQETWHSNLVQITLTNKNISTMKNYQSFDL